MTANKTYSTIAGIFAITYAYNLFWFFKNVIEFSSYGGVPLTFYIRYTPTFLGIAGVVIFISSQFKRNNLLRMIMCLEIISFPFLVHWYIQFFTRSYGPLDRPPQLNWTFYIGCIVNISLVAASVIGLRLLSFNKTARLSFTEIGSERIAQFSAAPLGLRFTNRLIDGIVITYVLMTNLEAFSGISGHMDMDDIEPEFFLIFEIPFLLLYYIIMEGIFNTTAGKCATNTTIVNEQGERPGFAQVLGRTFCRLIPFEAFSFFGTGSRGWHDTISNTYVTECINKEDQDINEIILDAELNDTVL